MCVFRRTSQQTLTAPWLTSNKSVTLFLLTDGVFCSDSSSEVENSSSVGGRIFFLPRLVSVAFCPLTKFSVSDVFCPLATFCATGVFCTPGFVLLFSDVSRTIQSGNLDLLGGGVVFWDCLADGVVALESCLLAGKACLLEAVVCLGFLPGVFFTGGGGDGSGAGLLFLEVLSLASIFSMAFMASAS